MSGFSGASDLEIQLDPRFQRREWFIQRVGWVVLALIISAALAGLLGPGPLSSTQLHSADGHLTFEYERYLHNAVPSELRIRVDERLTSGGELRLVLGRSFVDRIQLSGTTPATLREEAAQDEFVYVFGVRPNQPAEIVFDYQMTGYGWVEGQVRVADDVPLTFTQLVYP